jgi:hypothetical protein
VVDERERARFAAVNGMSAVFAHHMSPDLAFQALREYRRDFTARTEGAEPYSAMSVLAFASAAPSESGPARCRSRLSSRGTSVIKLTHGIRVD